MVKTKRISITIPLDDTLVLDWFSRQANKSASVRMLIHDNNINTHIDYISSKSSCDNTPHVDNNNINDNISDNINDNISNNVSDSISDKLSAVDQMRSILDS